MKRLVDFLASLRLAVLLLGALALLCGLATLVPQGMDKAWYQEAYAPALRFLVATFGFDSFFSSPLFLAVTGAFCVNLTACGLRRFMLQIKLGKKARYGADIVHLGILALAVSASFSGLTRESATVELAQGDAVELAPGYSFEVESLEALALPGGRPLDWRTLIRATTPVRPEGYKAVIGVNKPVTIGGITLYQYSWKRGEAARIRYSGGSLVLEEGSAVSLADGRSLEYNGPLVHRETGDKAAGLVVDGQPLVVPLGAQKDGLTLTSLGPLERTVLLLGRDRAYPAVLASFLVITLGLALAAYERLRELSKNTTKE